MQRRLASLVANTPAVLSQDKKLAKKIGRYVSNVMEEAKGAGMDDNI